MSTIYRGIADNASRAASRNISSSTNASPIVVTTTAAHGLSTGDRVDIVSHATNTAANGPWTITYLSPTTFSLNGSTGNGSGVATGSVTPFCFANGANVPDDGNDANASSIDVAHEANLDRAVWLAERIGTMRLVGRLNVTKAAATPGASITALTTAGTNAWGADSNSDTAWAVRPQIGVEVNDYVEVDMTGTVSVDAATALNVALGIGFAFTDYGASFFTTMAAIQNGYSQFESGHIHSFNLKSSLYLSTFLAGISRGSVLYPVLMNYGIAGGAKYNLLGDLSCTIKLWRPN